LLPDDERPDFRWILIGPPRSGSTFHIDPNCTSAWNALISGRKKWVLTPPGCPPPGVIPSVDLQEVLAPISVLEWFINFYSASVQQSPKLVEGIQGPGDIIFIPSGWYHSALNLEESIAVTQNVVTSQNLLKVVDFLQTKGATHPLLHERFNSAFRRAHPGELEKLQTERQKQQQSVESRKRERDSLWDRSGASFTFGFNFDDGN